MLKAVLMKLCLDQEWLSRDHTQVCFIVFVIIKCRESVCLGIIVRAVNNNISQEEHKKIAYNYIK